MNLLYAFVQDRLPPSRKGTVEDVKERIQIRDIIKFELSDARVPSKDNPKELKSLDMDTMGSRIVQVTHPAPTPETRTRTLRELPIGVQKAISHAFKSNYNLPYLDTVKYYFKEQTPKPLYSYDVGESNKAIVAPLVTTKLKAESPNKPWWQPAKLPSVPQLTSYTVISTPSPSSTTHRPLSLLKAYPMRYTYKYAPTTSRIIQYYGDKIQPKPYIYNKPLNPISITEIQSPNVLDDFPEVTTTNSVTSTAPVLFPVTPSPFPKNRNPLESLLKFYSSEKDIHNYFQSKDTLTLVKAAVEALREQNPHLDIMPKGIENNELIVRVTPKPEYLGQSTTTEKPEFSVPDLHSHLEPNLNYLSKPSSIDDVNVVRIVPTELHTISDVPTVPKNDAYVHLNNLTPGLNTHSEVISFLLFHIHHKSIIQQK